MTNKDPQLDLTARSQKRKVKEPAIREIFKFLGFLLLFMLTILLFFAIALFSAISNGNIP